MTNPRPTRKTCVRCEVERPISGFRWRTDRYDRICKECQNETVMAARHGKNSRDAWGCTVKQTPEDIDADWKDAMGDKHFDNNRPPREIIKFAPVFLRAF